MRPPLAERTPGGVAASGPRRLMKLTKSWQFHEVYDGGERVVCDYAVVFYRQRSEGEAGPCFGVVASRRVGGAVARNRAKRLLRETARAFAGRIRSPAMWVVLVARPAINGRSSREVAEDIGQALHRAGLTN